MGGRQRPVAAVSERPRWRSPVSRGKRLHLCSELTGGVFADSKAVATENRIRAGADAAIGYLRFGVIDLLKLLGGLLVGLFRSRAAREAEMAFLRQQAALLCLCVPASAIDLSA